VAAGAIKRESQARADFPQPVLPILAATTIVREKLCDLYILLSPPVIQSFPAKLVSRRTVRKGRPSCARSRYVLGILKIIGKPVAWSYKNNEKLMKISSIAGMEAITDPRFGL
jgi:hypothetical protein